MFAAIELSTDTFVKGFIITMALFLFVIFCRQPVCAEPYQRLETKHFFIKYVDAAEIARKHFKCGNKRNGGIAIICEKKNPLMNRFRQGVLRDTDFQKTVSLFIQKNYQTSFRLSHAS